MLINMFIKTGDVFCFIQGHSHLLFNINLIFLSFIIKKVNLKSPLPHLEFSTGSGNLWKPFSGVQASFLGQGNGLGYRADLSLVSHWGYWTRFLSQRGSSRRVLLQLKQNKTEVQTTIKTDFHINTTSQKPTPKVSSRPMIFRQF